MTYIRDRYDSCCIYRKVTGKMGIVKYCVTHVYFLGITNGGKLKMQWKNKSNVSRLNSQLFEFATYQHSCWKKPPIPHVPLSGCKGQTAETSCIPFGMKSAAASSTKATVFCHFCWFWWTAFTQIPQKEHGTYGQAMSYAILVWPFTAAEPSWVQDVLHHL